MPKLVCDSEESTLENERANARRAAKLALRRNADSTDDLASPHTVALQAAVDQHMQNTHKKGRAGSESACEVVRLVLPQHANHMGNTFGGNIMAWAEGAAHLAARTHCRAPVVCASLDTVNFVAPSTVGQVNECSPNTQVKIDL